MQISEFTSKLNSVRKNGSGFIAKCPAHDDKNPSLSVTASNDKILVKCFTGCESQNVVSALGLEFKDLYLENVSRPKNENFGQNALRKKPRIADQTSFKKSTSQSATNSKVVTVYEYTDENGEILYENIRYEPKDFWQRKPDGNGGYESNLNGVRRIPYRLPELIEAVKSGADIFLVEGEKDADNLRKLGLSATSFKNWRPEFNSHIAQAHVLLIQDHDSAGITQAVKACEMISGNCNSLKIIDLFENEPTPEKGGKDVSDWIDQQMLDGLDNEAIAERLSLIAGNAEFWKPSEQGSDDGSDSFYSAFKIQTANQWIADAKERPIPKMLFDSFWYEGEVAIMFADTGKGKTIKAVQIGDSISRGKSISNFKLEAEKQKILYLDFELSDKQFEARYSEKQNDHFTNHYEFDENFIRAEIDQENFAPERFKDFQDYLNFSLEYELANTESKILIVDNITFLKNGTETAKDALPLMKELIRLKKKFGLSILVLAHTPKRDLSRPLQVNDVQGSKMLSNFADSIFAIGESAKDKNLRYLKQIKCRNTEEIYHAENVATCQVIKDGNFLKFEFLKFECEREHLKTYTDSDKDQLIAEAKIRHQNGESMQSIADAFGMSKMTISRYVKQ